MLFNSLSFLLFFIAVTSGYFLLPHRFRWALLLIASAVFYMAFVPIYILILVGTILVDYVAGLLIERSTGPARRWCLAASIVANVGILAFFKYYNFLDDSAVRLAHLLGSAYIGRPLAFLLPLGLSFHTFQAMSYTVEVYRGKHPAERHLGIYALYVLFYPQLVAGPIERPQNILYQFYERHSFDGARVSAGLSRMLWGLFKKMVIADRLAYYVDSAYDAPSSCPRLWLVAATYLFAVEIYCDFSGYTDVALGAARVMGFRLLENFDTPYFASSATDFWRRWHMSLSTWFRDYVYFPMGGSRVASGRLALNVMVVFLLSGLWHGASWAFVIWGGLHGSYLLTERWTAPYRDRAAAAVGLARFPRLRAILGWAVTFNLICLAWIFFRAGTMAVVAQVAGRLFGRTHGVVRAIDFTGLLLVLAFVAVLAIVEAAGGGDPVNRLLVRAPRWVRWPICYAMVLAILWKGVLGQRSFIYFQF